MPDSKIIYVAGTDKCIKEVDNGKLKHCYEANVNISQIAMMHGGRALFAGSAEDDRPGVISVFKLPFDNFEKLFEI